MCVCGDAWCGGRPSSPQLLSPDLRPLPSLLPTPLLLASACPPQTPPPTQIQKTTRALTHIWVHAHALGPKALVWLKARYSSGELQGGGLVRRSSRSIGALSRMFAETEDAEPAEPSTPATTDRSTDEESPES